MTSAQIVPTVLVPFLVWRVYSRVRRNIGRQPLRPSRLRGAVIFFSIIVGLIALSALRAPMALVGLGGGLLLAVPLALLALRLTQFHDLPDGKFYTPNTYIGLGVTLLFIGRITYRIVMLAGTPMASGPPAAIAQSPLTLFVFGVTAGYYITYYASLLIRGGKKTEPGATA